MKNPTPRLLPCLSTMLRQRHSPSWVEKQVLSAWNVAQGVLKEGWQQLSSLQAITIISQPWPWDHQAQEKVPPQGKICFLGSCKMAQGQQLDSTPRPVWASPLPSGSINPWELSPDSNFGLFLILYQLPTVSLLTWDSPGRLHSCSTGCLPVTMMNNVHIVKKMPST